jgi:hypothetical protein
MSAKESRSTVNYFGLSVEVICQLESCSLIRFNGQESIVETKDLVCSKSLKQAA